jgi:DNA mismatch repair protein MSH2
MVENENEFILVNLHMITKSNEINFGFSIINTLEKSIGLSEYQDNEFFSTTENVLLQCAPLHESISFIVIGNFPNEFYGQKFKNILLAMGITNPEISINSKFYNLTDFKENLKIIIEDNALNNNFLISNDVLNAKVSLNGGIRTKNLLQFSHFSNYFNISIHKLNEFMYLDNNALRCLNIFNFNGENEFHFQNIGNDKRNNSLYSVINKCSTKFGHRLLKNWILHPLQKLEEINNRLNMVEIFVENTFFTQEVRQVLSKITDLQSLNMKFYKFVVKKINPSIDDCAKVKVALSICFNLAEYLNKYEDDIHKDLFEKSYISPLNNTMLKLKKLDEFLNKAVFYDEKTRENIVNPSFNQELKQIKEKLDQNWSKILELKESLIDEYSLKTLKTEDYIKEITFTVTKKEGEKILSDKSKNFILISSNKNNLIFSSSELKNLSKFYKVYIQEFKEKQNSSAQQVYDIVASYHPLIEKLVIMLSELDIFSSYAAFVKCSKEAYTKPIIVENERHLILKDARHIILENNELLLKTKASCVKKVIPNDCYMDEKSSLQIITGINMGGKSTFLRQVGINVLLAHCGFYLPCSYAKVPLIDKIITRVGSGDSMVKGISTFMNEMLEVSSMLNIATKYSLLLIDELGRGTSTDEGIGISYAILTEISKNIECLCLFATHFHELTSLDKELVNVKNLHVSYSVNSQKHDLDLHYKILDGATDKSYGLNILRVLNFPEEIIEKGEQDLKMK